MIAVCEILTVWKCLFYHRLYNKLFCNRKGLSPNRAKSSRPYIMFNNHRCRAQFKRLRESVPKSCLICTVATQWYITRWECWDIAEMRRLSQFTSSSHGAKCMALAKVITHNGRALRPDSRPSSCWFYLIFSPLRSLRRLKAYMQYRRGGWYNNTAGERRDVFQPLQSFLWRGDSVTQLNKPHRRVYSKPGEVLLLISLSLSFFPFDCPDRTGGQATRGFVLYQLHNRPAPAGQPLDLNVTERPERVPDTLAHTTRS